MDFFNLRFAFFFTFLLLKYACSMRCEPEPRIRQTGRNYDVGIVFRKLKFFSTFWIVRIWIWNRNYSHIDHFASLSATTPLLTFVRFTSVSAMAHRQTLIHLPDIAHGREWSAISHCSSTLSIRNGYRNFDSMCVCVPVCVCAWMWMCMWRR